MRIRKICLLGVSMLAIGAAHADLTPAEQEALDRKTVTSKYYVDQQVATKQDVIGAESGNYVVMYPDSTSGDGNGGGTHDEAGEIDKRHIATSLSVGTTPSGADGVEVGATDIPTVGAVNTGLAGKQANIPANNTAVPKVVTYTSSAGTVGSHDIYQGASAAYNANGLIQADHANAAIQNGLNAHLTCGGTVDGTQNGTCWLWTIQNQTGTPVYTPHSSGS